MSGDTTALFCEHANALCAPRREESPAAAIVLLPFLPLTETAIKRAAVRTAEESVANFAAPTPAPVRRLARDDRGPVGKAAIFPGLRGRVVVSAMKARSQTEEPVT